MRETETTSLRPWMCHLGWCKMLSLAVLIPLCLILAALLSIAADSARAVPAWLVAESVGTGDEVVDPRIGLDGNGNVLAIWLEDGGDSMDALRVRVRPAGAAWTATQDIIVGSVETPVKIDPTSPQISVNDLGNVAVVWQRVDPVTSSSSIQAMIGSMTGVRAVPTTISEDENAINPSIVIDLAGNAGAIWVSDPDPSQPGDEQLRCALWEVGAGRWTDSYDVSPPNENITASEVYPRVDVDGEGDALAIWVNDQSSGEEDIVRGAYRTAGGPGRCLGLDGGGWTPTNIARESTNVSDVQLAVNTGGDAVAVWRLGPSGNGGAIRAVVGSTDKEENWSEPFDIAQTGASNDVQAPNVGIDGQGNAVVVWRRHDSEIGADTIRASVWVAADEAWSTPTDIAQVGDHPAIPQIAVNALGRAVVSWEGKQGADSPGVVIQAAVGSTDPEERWTGPVAISDSGASLTPRGRNYLALDPAGNAVATWLREGDMQVAIYDATPPRLDGLSVPVSGTAGSSLSFSVSPFDIWSSTQTVWDFGDGATTSGAAVSHTYTDPGTYQVRVSATDIVGNVTTETVPIEIEEIPPESRPAPPDAPNSAPPGLDPIDPPESTPNPRTAVLGRLSMRIRCLRSGRKAARKRSGVSGRLTKCRRSKKRKGKVKQARKLLVNLRASQNTKVKITITGRRKKARKKRRARRTSHAKVRKLRRYRTVLVRKAKVKRGANRIVLSLPARARGNLRGEVSVVGTKSSRKVRVRE